MADESSEEWLTLIGPRGWWQLRTWLLLVPLMGTIYGIGANSIILGQFAPKHTCTAWQGEPNSSLTPPPNNYTNQCRRNGTECLRWSYDRSKLKRTIVTQVSSNGEF